jgi:hypothetical protein
MHIIDANILVNSRSRMLCDNCFGCNLGVRTLVPNVTDADFGVVQVAYLSTMIIQINQSINLEGTSLQCKSKKCSQGQRVLC